MIDLANYTAGKQVKHPTGYAYFMPTNINDQWVWDNPQINSLLEKAANDLVSAFVAAGILKEMTGENRNRLFVFNEYVKLF